MGGFHHLIKSHEAAAIQTPLSPRIQRTVH